MSDVRMNERHGSAFDQRHAMKLPILASILAAVHVLSSADEFYKVESDHESDGLPFPDHLIPVSSHLDSWHREYRRRIEDHLFKTPPDVAQYLVIPAFDPESCVSIRSEVPKKIRDAADLFIQIPKEHRKYFITVTTASENLWYSMAEHNDEKKTRSVETIRIDREISRELAAAIQRAWGRMLHHTRVPSSALVNGVDGCTYEFAARIGGLREVCGQTWSPQGGLTAELVALGDRIAAFATEQDTPEESLLRALNAFEAKIPDVDVSPVFILPPSATLIDRSSDPFAKPKGQGEAGKDRTE